MESITFSSLTSPQPVLKKLDMPQKRHLERTNILNNNKKVVDKKMIAETQLRSVNY